MAALGQLQEVYGLWYNTKNFMLDGYKFTGCRFDNCTLHINSAKFELINCHIDDKTIITYGTEPLKIIQLYNSRNEHAYKYAGFFSPHKNEDNTITITGAF